MNNWTILESIDWIHWNAPGIQWQDLILKRWQLEAHDANLSLPMKLNVQRIGKVFRLEVNLRFINSNSIAGRHHPVNLYIVLSYRKNSMAHKMKFALCTFSKHDDYQQMLQNSSLDGMKPLAHFRQGGFKRKTFIVGFHLHMRSEPGPILEKWLIFMVALIQQVHADRSVVLMPARMLDLPNA